MSDITTNKSTNTIPYGYCQCGCGQKTTIATKTDTWHGRIRGEPMRFVTGHHMVKSRVLVDESALLPGTRAIPLTRGKFAIVDESDYERVSHFRWHAQPSRNMWYAMRSETLSSGKQRTISLHRVILNAPDGTCVDHADGDGLNNTRANLRTATHTQNTCNSRIYANNTSGFKGVSWRAARSKWVARIRVSGKIIFLGSFDTTEEAARAYDEAAREHYGEFARLNFPVRSNGEYSAHD